MAKTKNIVVWLVQVTVSLLFFSVSIQKLISTDEVVANFKHWEMPDHFYLVIGTFELLGAIGLLIPRSAGMAALGLMFIMAGAIYTHIIHDPAMMLILPSVTLVLLAFIAYTRNPMAIFADNAR